MTRARFRVVSLLGAAGLMAGLLVSSEALAAKDVAAQHVLLISIDGLHQSDLAWYVRTHPRSALARLVRGGVEFTNAQTPVPSDSFPGMVAQVTGGNPSSTGIFYDDSFNHALLPAGTTNCKGVAPGVEVTYFEQADLNPHSIDAGQGLSGLPGTILQLTGNARSLINPAQLPVDPTTCKPVYPHQYINIKVGAMAQALNDRHLDHSTAIILSAKHGQSPQTPSALTRIPDGPIMDALNAAWKASHPAATAPLVAFSINDDGMMIWLNDRSSAATSFAKNFLLNHSGVGNDINSNPKPYTASGLKTVFAGAQAAAYFGVAVGDSRVPDVFGISRYGSVYTGGHGKIAEHGGANPQDRNVPLVVSGAGVDDHEVNHSVVETTQIAPTILKLLGLNPNALQAVQIEHTKALQLES